METNRTSMASMKTEEIMTKKVITTEPERSVAEFVEKMVENDVECLPVTKSGTLQGIITFRDIVTNVVRLARDPEKTKAKDIMSKNTVTCSPDSTILEVAKLMKKRRLRRIPIVAKNKKLVGIVTNFDLAVLGWDFGPV